MSLHDDAKPYRKLLVAFGDSCKLTRVVSAKRMLRLRCRVEESERDSQLVVAMYLLRKDFKIGGKNSFKKRLSGRCKIVLEIVE